jgi:hypothetical protein
LSAGGRGRGWWTGGRCRRRRRGRERTSAAPGRSDKSRRGEEQTHVDSSRSHGGGEDGGGTGQLERERIAGTALVCQGPRRRGVEVRRRVLSWFVACGGRFEVFTRPNLMLTHPGGGRPISRNLWPLSFFFGGRGKISNSRLKPHYSLPFSSPSPPLAVLHLAPSSSSSSCTRRTLN